MEYVQQKYDHLVKNIKRSYSKLANTDNKIKFLKKCIEYRVFPKYINNIVNDRSLISNNFNYTNYDTLKSYNTTFKQKILKLELRSTYKNRNFINRELNIKLHHLEHMIDERQFFMLNKQFRTMYERTYKYKKGTYDKKFKSLSENLVERYYEIVKNSDEFIENVSNINLSDSIKRGLILGPKFSYSVNNEKNVLKLLADVELVLEKLKNTKNRNVMKNKIVNVINNHINRKKPSKLDRVIKNDIKNTLKFKRDNKENLVILDSDKNNKIVLYSRELYNQKVKTIIDDDKKYQIVEKPKNPIKKSEKIIKDILDKLKDKNCITQNCHQFLVPKNSRPGYMYFKAKIHKPDKSLRPIITSYSTPNANLSKYLGKILRKIVNNDHRVKNSGEAILKLQNLKVKHNQSLLSLDISCLFPNIPLEIIREIIHDKWGEIAKYTNMSETLFLETFDICLENNIFKFDDKYYKQVGGTPIGNPISSVLGDLFVDYVHQKIIKKYYPILMVYYVDDSLCILENNKIENLIYELNNVHSNIKYTIEYETDNQITFLDIKIIKDDSGNLKTDLYKKPEKSSRAISYFSEHPEHQKKNLIINEINRIKKISSAEFIDEKIELMREKFIKNSYPDVYVDLVMEKTYKNQLGGKNNNKKDNMIVDGSIPYIPGLSNIIKRYLSEKNLNVVYNVNKPLGTLINNKCKLEKFDQSGVVYGIVCSTCKNNNKNTIYIGQTSRELRVRMKEHFSSLTKKSGLTALSIHAIDEKHEFDIDNAIILHHESNTTKRLFYESFYINIYDNESINYKVDRERSQVVYGNLIQKTKKRLYNQKIFNNN